MIGAVIFTDPGDDRNMAAGNYATYPDGPARNPTSIQKGSVMDLSTYPGDPTTPGYPSKEGVVRKEKKTEYRQYMNRVGGFNRPLSPSR